MPQPVEPRDEPDWVKRLRADGFDVQGGLGNLPLDPLASFDPMPERRWATITRAILRWVRPSHRIARLRRHAPVP
jgi:hypothetical protein